MGWTLMSRVGVPTHDSKWRDNKPASHPAPVSRRSLPLFHANAATLPEMLACLGKMGDVEITCWFSDIMEVEARLIHTNMHSLDMTLRGRSINEAVARLVVAVAKAGEA